MTDLDDDGDLGWCEDYAASMDAKFNALIDPNVPDAVHRPNHYARFLIEPITFILANSLPYDVGNVVKYVCRYDAKNGVEDLRKAIRYCEIIIERVEREERIEQGEDARDVWKDIV